MNFTDKSGEALSRIEKFSAFLTVGEGEKANPMTIGWAFFGISCGKPCLTVMVRTSRFSKHLLDENPYFTVSIPKDFFYKNALGICGSKSGKDTDKFALCALEKEKSDKINVPGIKNCLIYECSVIFKSEMKEDLTMTPERERWYKNGDYHTLYTAEILNVKGE